MIKVAENQSLKSLNTLALDAVAARYVSFDDPQTDLPDLWRQGCFSRDFVVLGHGANILFTGDFQGTVLHPDNVYIKRLGEAPDGRVEVAVGAGMLWDDVIEKVLDMGLCGCENLSGIPADMGGAVVQNIGAYGMEISAIVVSVTAFDVTSGVLREISAADCAFGYRTSAFKKRDNKLIITDVRLLLPKQDDAWQPNLSYAGLRSYCAENQQYLASPKTIREAVINIRNSKLPDPAIEPNAGSFFKNSIVDKALADSLLAQYPEMPHWAVDVPGKVKLSGGWLIEKSGWKGRSLGPVGIHRCSALVVVNNGGGTNKDILRLVEAVTADVFARFGVELQPEVLFI